MTSEKGTDRLVGNDPAAVLPAIFGTLDGPPPPAVVPDLWDGRAAARIFDILERSVQA